MIFNDIYNNEIEESILPRYSIFIASVKPFIHASNENEGIFRFFFLFFGKSISKGNKRVKREIESNGEEKNGSKIADKWTEMIVKLSSLAHRVDRW